MSLIHPDTERLRQAFASLARGAEAGQDCPPPEKLWIAVRGELSPGETRELVDHTSSCPSCAEDWRLARQIGSADETPADQVSVRTARIGKVWYLVAAAVLAVAATAVFWQMAREPVSPAEYRAPAESSIRSITAERVPLPRSEALLRWAIDGEFDSFTVRVATEDLETLSVGRKLTSPEYLVPVTELEGLQDGSRLLWQVEAYLPDGDRVVSPTFVNRLE